MRINQNIMAINAHRRLNVNQEASSKAMEKLSSGMRINRAGDDAAGLAISEKMRGGQIRGPKAGPKKCPRRYFPYLNGGRRAQRNALHPAENAGTGRAGSN